MWVIATGSPFDGLHLTGPFATSEEAIEHAQDHFEKWEVIYLNPPLSLPSTAEGNHEPSK